MAVSPQLTMDTNISRRIIFPFRGMRCKEKCFLLVPIYATGEANLTRHFRQVSRQGNQVTFNRPFLNCTSMTFGCYLFDATQKLFFGPNMVKFRIQSLRQDITGYVPAVVMFWSQLERSNAAFPTPGCKVLCGTEVNVQLVRQFLRRSNQKHIGGDS